MRELKALILYLAFLPMVVLPVCELRAQQMLPGILDPQAKVVAGGCTLQPMTNEWQFWNAGNTCGTGVACSYGAGLRTVVDAVSGNTATQTASANQPIYTAGEINGLAGGAFTSSNAESLNLATAIPYTWSIYSGFAVYYMSSGGSTQTLIASSTYAYAPVWQSDSSQIFVSLGASTIDNGTPLPTNAWVAVAWQWNTATGAWVIWRLSSGSATVIGSGTTSVAMSSTNLLNQIGEAGYYNYFFNAPMAELGLLNGSFSPSTAATYVSCQYGL